VEDDELVRRARSGDREAFGMLVARHQQVAFRTAYVICGDEAEDATQEAFVKAYRALWRFRRGAPWRREHLAAQAAAATPPRPPMPDYTAAELTAALDRLEAPHREVVLLRHVLELSEAETAAALGCRPGTVKSRLSRGLARLREELA
jgi:DNA-directed RNA polymerase specialized sigma24 family protein